MATKRVGRGSLKAAAFLGVKAEEGEEESPPPSSPAPPPKPLLSSPPLASLSSCPSTFFAPAAR